MNHAIILIPDEKLEFFKLFMRGFAAPNKANALFGISIARFFQWAQSAHACELRSQAIETLLNVSIEKEYKRSDSLGGSVKGDGNPPSRPIDMGLLTKRRQPHIPVRSKPGYLVFLPYLQKTQRNT